MVGVAQDGNYWVRHKRPWIGEKTHHSEEEEE